MPPDSRAQDRAEQLCLQSAGKAGIIKAQHAAGLFPCPVRMYRIYTHDFENEREGA